MPLPARCRTSFAMEVGVLCVQSTVEIQFPHNLALFHAKLSRGLFLWVQIAFNRVPFKNFAHWLLERGNKDGVTRKRHFLFWFAICITSPPKTRRQVASQKSPKHVFLLPQKKTATSILASTPSPQCTTSPFGLAFWNSSSLVSEGQCCGFWSKKVSHH